MNEIITLGDLVEYKGRIAKAIGFFSDNVVQFVYTEPPRCPRCDGILPFF